MPGRFSERKSIQQILNLLNQSSTKVAALKQALRFGPIQPQELFNKSLYLVSETRWINRNLVQEYPAVAGWLVTCVAVLVETPQNAFLLHSFLSRNIAMLVHKEALKPIASQLKIGVYSRPTSDDYWDQQQAKHVTEIVGLLDALGLDNRQISIELIPGLAHVFWDGTELRFFSRQGESIIVI